MEVCELYLDCVAAAAPSALPDAQSGYGPDGTCWQGSPATAEQCIDACRAGLDQWHEALPDEPRSVAVPGQAGGGAGDIGGLYLFAVSAVIGPETPLQYLAIFETGADAITSLSLQPLTLDPLGVTSPCEPFGDPLHFTDIPVVDGAFEVDLGTLEIAGQTNPVTGSDITVELVVSGSIGDGGLICGTVDGRVTEPVEVDLGGSTVRTRPDPS